MIYFVAVTLGARGGAFLFRFQLIMHFLLIVISQCRVIVPRREWERKKISKQYIWVWLWNSTTTHTFFNEWWNCLKKNKNIFCVIFARFKIFLCWWWFGTFCYVFLLQKHDARGLASKTFTKIYCLDIFSFPIPF